jgi:hypothetical protein
VTDLPPVLSRGREGDESCTHPWLRVVCGECGDPVELGPEPSGSAGQTELPSVPAGADYSRGVFIVARGNPELVEQLKAVMGHSAEIQIIEDRRQAPREVISPEEIASKVRTKLRHRLLEEGPDDRADGR